MNNFKIGSLAVITLLLVLFMHLKGMAYHLYLNYWFYDIIMHVLGGIGIALSALYILKNPKYIIPATIFAGVVWELFEMYYGIAGAKLWTNAYYADTIKDLFDDTLGSVIIYFIVVKNENLELINLKK